MGRLGTWSKCEDVFTALPEGSAAIAGSSAIVTGSSAGIGEEAAYHLAVLGLHVVLAVRNVPKGEAVVENFRSRAGSAKGPDLKLTVMKLDTSDLASVKSFLEEFKRAAASLPPLRVLVNNAGIFPTNNTSASAQGHELTFATNYLGHFALTNGLLPILRQNKPARVVIVSSHSHYGPCGMDTSSLDAIRASVTVPKQPSWNPLSSVKTYGDSKLLNVLHAQELAAREGPDGVTVCSLHPGTMITTDIVHGHNAFVRFLWRYIISPFTKNINQGASTTMYGLVAPAEEVHGRYLSSCKVCDPSKAATKDAQQRAWQLSEELVGQQG